MPDYSKIKDNVNNRPIQVQSAIEDGDKKNIQDYYAKQDGFYGGMGVGKSLATESIISDREIEDSEVACSPITFGPTGDGAEIADGISQFDYLEGNSQKWNQRVNISPLVSAWLDIRQQHFVFQPHSGGYQNNIQTLSNPIPANHKVLLILYKNSGVVSGTSKLGAYNSSTYAYQGYISLNVANGYNAVLYTTTNEATKIRIALEDNFVVTETFDAYLNYIDLTAIYGAGNEPATVEEFKSKYPLDYYPYDAGSIISSKSYSIISKGKNQFEGLDTLTRVLPNTEYELSGITAGGYIQEYDANKNLIQTSTEITTTTDITLSANTYYVKIQATTYSNIMFYIAYETYNARYVEPTKQTIQLPNIELRSVGDVRDIAYSAGGGLRYTRIVNLGTLNWRKETISGIDLFVTNDLYNTIALHTTDFNTSNWTLCSKYQSIGGAKLVVGDDKKLSTRPWTQDGNILIVDSDYSDATAFTNAMNGVYLVYELATPTEIPLSENPGWNSDIVVNNYGTLQFTTNPEQLPQVKQPYLIKYSINLVEFTDSAYVRTSGDANNIALQSDMNEVKKDISDFKTGEQSVALSENLDSNMLLPDNTPYLFRSTGGALEVGNHCYENAIVGGSIVVNQLARQRNTNHDVGGLDITNHDDYVTIQGTYTGEDTNIAFINPYPFTLNQAHKYLVSIYMSQNGSSTTFMIGGKTTSSGWVIQNTSSLYFVAEFKTGAVIDGTFAVNIFDLTLMFGNQIANYLYTIDQAIPGSALTWVRKFLPKDYYPYTATPYFLNVKTSGKKVVGFNAYNNTTGTAKLLGGYQYQITGTYTSVTYLDINGNTETLTIDSDGKFTPANDGVLTVSGGNDTDTCVHLVWDGERDGQYEEYNEITYPTSSTELRGILKLDSDNNLYYDGDRYGYDGTVDRRYGVVDLGSLTWSKSGNHFYVDAVSIQTALKPKAVANGNIVANIICTSFDTNAANNINNETQQGIGISVGGSIPLYISDYASYTTDQLQTALSGIYLIYELATSTTETADAFTQRQQDDNWGTEEYIDDRTIPMLVGHDTEYLLDLKAKVEVAPESPDTDGNYVLKRESGVNTYTNLDSCVDRVLDKSSDATSAGISNLVFKKAYKIGNIVTLTVRTTAMSNWSAGSTIFTLASGLYNSQVTVSGIADVAGNQAIIYVNNTGTVTCNASISTGQELKFTITYAVA